MYCSHCGFENLSSYNFCVSCGHKMESVILNKPITDVKRELKEKPDTNQVKTEASSNTLKTASNEPIDKTSIIAGIIAVLFALGLIIYKINTI
jgi:uncharacterized membrane protein YvbJ